MLSLVLPRSVDSVDAAKFTQVEIATYLRHLAAQHMDRAALAKTISQSNIQSAIAASLNQAANSIAAIDIAQA